MAWFYVLMIVLGSSSGSPQPPDEDLGAITTKLLANILNGYDKNLRPSDENGLTTVNISILVKSMGPVSDIDMAYQMDVYFRQMWQDNRLKFRGRLTKLTLSVDMLRDIWKPDTFFFNGMDSYVHTITRPNKFLRIDQNGVIWYSIRLTIKATCPVKLHSFPMDNQTCALWIGSYAYTESEVKYNWVQGGGALEFDKSVTLSQFELIAWPFGNETMDRGPNQFSMLWIRFHLKRHMGYYLLQVYVPAILVVVLSWLAFTLNREATCDRVSLGVTCVLTLAQMSIDTRSSLPPVSYATALDYFVILCFSYTIAATVQTSAVHYFTKRGFGENDHEDSEPEEPGPEECESCLVMINQGPTKYEEESLFIPKIGVREGDTKYENMRRYEQWKLKCNHRMAAIAERDENHNVKTQRPKKIVKKKRQTKDSILWQTFKCIIWDESYRRKLVARAIGGQNSTSRIDYWSQLLFPITFIILNLIYWYGYMN